MVCLWKWILIDLFERNPSEIHRTFEFDLPGDIPAHKYVHQNFKMRIGMRRDPASCDGTG